MPTYQVTTTPNCLTADLKQRVAQAITRAHSEATGANNYFAQVLFTEKATEDYYLGGQRLKQKHLFVHGTVRARSLEHKQVLIAGLLPAIAEAAGLHPRYVWVYLADLPPELMVEFGHVLPQPGGEAAWTAGLPEEDRQYMLSTDYMRAAD
jgi:phenylpyruvate tautomerase PptA (4-oxalocrotonate tautomerase family)